ncbi:MAG: hypothetical protein CSA74_03610 [Rhodobacterales bacterium]|nr:MAG: hypothetical protein CSA74_03610 [Rhodobacterales bacterium]
MKSLQPVRAARAGLAPITRQSGRWRGHAVIQGGRKPLRDALYMPAVVAVRFKPDMKAQYDRKKAAGKPSKVALMAIILKRLTKYQTQRASPDALKSMISGSVR